MSIINNENSEDFIDFTESIFKQRTYDEYISNLKPDEKMIIVVFNCDDKNVKYPSNIYTIDTCHYLCESNADVKESILYSDLFENTKL